MGEFSRHLPPGYHWLAERGLAGFEPGTSLQPWYLLHEDDLFDVAARWPNGPLSNSALGPLVAFARRQDCDDIACCRLIDGNPRIYLIHGWTDASVGYTIHARHADLWSWLKAVIDDVAEWAAGASQRDDDALPRSIRSRIKPPPFREGTIEDEILAAIAKHGWMSMDIAADTNTPCFMYTVGFMETLGHPEVVVSGLVSATAHRLICNVHAYIRSGKSLREPGAFELVPGVMLRVRPVDESQHAWRLGYAMWHRFHVGKAGSLEAVQVLWPDSNGRFPGDPKCDPQVAASQPDLTAFRAGMPKH